MKDCALLSYRGFFSKDQANKSLVCRGFINRMGGICRLVLALAAAILLLSASTAGALVCPPPEELQVVDGWWSAPGGWQQDRAYKKPAASTRITDFAAASFQGNLRGPGKLMCLYVVDGQAPLEFTKIFHPSSGGPMDFDWDCPPDTTGITCTCVGIRRSDCEVCD